MNSFDVAEARLLIALYIDHHRPGRRMLSRAELADEYGLSHEPKQFAVIAADLAAQDIVKTFRAEDGPAVVLRDEGVREAHRRILAYLKATTFDVFWEGQRIATDSRLGPDKMPGRRGWLLATIEPEPVPAPATTAPEPQPPGTMVAGRDIYHVVHSPNANIGSGETRSGGIATLIWTVVGGVAAVAAVVWAVWIYINPGS